MQEPDLPKENSWSALQYTKFEKERNRPIMDLLSHLPYTQIRKAVDLGCGPGNSTELLSAHYPDAMVFGIDSSADMIKAAQLRMPNAGFEVADISDWHGEGAYDLILANASLQWVPDHQALFPSLIGKLVSGGHLAVQMPDNFEEPAHQLMRLVAEQGPWRSKLKLSGAANRLVRESAAWYYKELHSRVKALDIWRTTYFHPLKGGPEAIVEWFKGTGLRPFLDPLNEDEKRDFLLLYSHEIAKAYPAYEDGTVLLPFPRLFIIATR